MGPPCAGLLVSSVREAWGTDTSDGSGVRGTSMGGEESGARRGALQAASADNTISRIRHSVRRVSWVMVGTGQSQVAPGWA